MEITERLKEIILAETNVNIEAVTRERNTIELRALYYNLIKHFEPKITLSNIAESVNKNHATVINGLNNYDIYERFNNDLRDLRKLIIKQMESEKIQATTDRNILKLAIEQKDIKILQLELELELIKTELKTFKKTEYKAVKNIVNLLNEIKGTEHQQVMILRLEAIYDMNMKVIKQKGL